MLGFNKSGVDKMKSILDEAQQYLIEHQSKDALEEYQRPLIPSTQTFVQFGRGVEQGDSPIMGLINYCDNAITVVSSSVEKNVIKPPIVIHIGEKMAHVATVLKHVVDASKLSSSEISALSKCEKKARAWLDNQDRVPLMTQVSQRVTEVKALMAEKGVLHCIKHQSDVLRPLLSWA